MTPWPLAVLLVVAAVISVKRYPALHPAQLWAIPWALSGLTFALNLLPYREIRLTSAALIALSVYGFIAGTEFARRRGLILGAPQLKIELTRRPAALEAAAGIGFVVAAAWCLAFFVQASNELGLGNVLSADYAVRQAIGGGAFDATIKFTYAALGSTALAAVAAGRAETTRRRCAWLAISALSVAMIYLATGRSTLIAAAVIASVGFILSARIRVSRRGFAVGGLLAAALAVIVFLVGGAITGKTFTNNPDLVRLPNAFNAGPDLPDWMALPYEYLSAPIAASDVQLGYIVGVGGSGGCATLPEACDALQKLGFDTEPIDRVRLFTAHPLPWNTYTSIDSPALDFGWVPTAPFFFLIGIVSGALWNRAEAGGPGSIAIYALLVPALITGFNVFNFTAPHVIGSMFYAAAILMVTTFLPRTPQEAAT